MSRSRKIAASLILTGGLVLSGVAAPAMAATGPAKKHSQEVKTVYNEFATAYQKEVRAIAKSDPKVNAQICQNFTDGGTNKKGQDVATIQALVTWNDKKNTLTVNGKPWRKNRQQDPFYWTLHRNVEVALLRPRWNTSHI